MRKIIINSLCYLFISSGYLTSNPIQQSGSAVSILSSAIISVPGNYRLANDIIGTLTIAASNVFLDMNHKTISGNTQGILVTAGQSEIIIQNGVIENATSDGILIDSCINVQLLSLDVIGCVTGISILTCTAVIIDSCVCKNNTAEGLKFDNCNNLKVSNNESIFNAVNGIHLINSSVNNIITKNIINNNVQGIFLENSAYTILIENTCTENTTGILVRTASFSNIIINNICLHNAIGINVRDTGTDDNIINDNVCSNNSAAGTAVSGSNNSVQNNVSDSNGIGFSNTGAGNLFFFNAASNNTTNYSGILIGTIQTPGSSPQVAGVNIDTP